MNYRNRASDEFFVKKQYLASSYQKDPLAAGIISEGIQHTHNYNCNSRKTQIQSHLSYNPVKPLPYKNLHPNYQKQFSDTQIDKGPQQQPLLQPRRPFIVADNINIQFDDQSTKTQKSLLQQRISNYIKPEHHVTDQSMQLKNSLRTDFYNPSIRSHDVFSMPQVDNRANYQRTYYQIDDKIIDQTRFDQSKIMLNNAEKYFD
ncbi:hypothetical protein SS50377_25848 [Spironucleus salmonicida]|uniref:Uncharacterized protein n=1 Tax=Spironucleus salmonicida TaxID=348837 RepID=V6LP00_9EUKA|nr:hypothetical protein SS50377_25848 [Spironucleus salmonicida]|eukprot:EST45446.1 Hypothetical protein SS50377_14639 [Spironucleus salmonicida]